MKRDALFQIVGSDIEESSLEKEEISSDNAPATDFVLVGYLCSGLALLFLLSGINLCFFFVAPNRTIYFFDVNHHTTSFWYSRRYFSSSNMSMAHFFSHLSFDRYNWKRSTYCSCLFDWTHSRFMFCMCIFFMCT